MTTKLHAGRSNLAWHDEILEGISQTDLREGLKIGVVKRDEMESSISRAGRLFLEQRVPEKPWPTSFRDNVGNTRALPMNNDVARPCVTFIISLFYAAAISPVSLSLSLLFFSTPPSLFLNMCTRACTTQISHASREGTSG